MRIVKFRVWDSKFNKMFGPGTFSIDSGDGRITGFDRALDGLHSENDLDFIITQFTGLLDKNGKEIYEGDIIGGNEFNKYCEDMPVAVKYSGHEFVAYSPNCCLVCKSGDGCIGGLAEALCMGANEILGNIYESPELLNPKDNSGKQVEILSDN